MIHIYCGKGKGKTTAATGLTVRMAGNGGRVLFAQFFKDGSSSEISVLKNLENVDVRHCDTLIGFFDRMTDEEKEKVTCDYSAFLKGLLEEAPAYDLVVLDESISAYNHGVYCREDLLDFLKEHPEKPEIVLTGRDPAPELFARADYVTEMTKHKHPFENGVEARKGIEY
ncbi:MAG: cob(I)yrinic acid a,c-diamide adenosyltransferase [Parasporobacterium sp.]|nr:cob(I)yrinic acid a,c-diamide adenosyltransferase [Parasporobacterium sp.]